MAETRFKPQVTSFQLRDAQNGIRRTSCLQLLWFHAKRNSTIILQSSLSDTEACRVLDQAAIWMFSQWCGVVDSVLLGYGVTSLAEQFPTVRSIVIYSSLRGKMSIDVRTSVPSNISELCCFSTSETAHSVARYRITVEQILQLNRVFEMCASRATWLVAGHRVWKLFP
jgi:hypothetical protein